MSERQITHAPHGHILANAGVWSPDGCWLVYDVRSDLAGSVFDGDRIEKVNVDTGEVRVLYESRNGACCGIPTYHPTENKIVFTVGPEHPTPEWRYSASHRHALLLDENSGRVVPLDARDLIPPFTAGALRGGTHLHTFSPDGTMVAFTYEDAFLEQRGVPGHPGSNPRNVGVSILNRPVRTTQSHPRNQDGAAFSVLVTSTHLKPRPASDEIQRACEEAWVGRNGYEKSDGTRQNHAIAFQGTVIAANGAPVPEVFIADLANDLAVPRDGPLAGTEATLPQPPRGVTQRRLTFTTGRKHPGIRGPRHWLRTAPDGSQIAFLMSDDAGVVQLWTVSPNGGPPLQVTHGDQEVASAFTWHPRGAHIAYFTGRRAAVTEVTSGETRYLFRFDQTMAAPRPEACVFSPDGTRVAFVRPVSRGADRWNQIFVVSAG